MESGLSSPEFARALATIAGAFQNPQVAGQQSQPPQRQLNTPLQPQVQGLQQPSQPSSGSATPSGRGRLAQN